jgi:hypothetical protein
MKRAYAILSSVACLALQYFSTLSHKRHDFQKKKVIEHKTWFLIICTTLCETFPILRRTEGNMMENAYWSLRTVAVIHVVF